ncbi:MAG: hypothetical protein ACJ789_21245 [Thermomicrobiales bacterium]
MAWETRQRGGHYYTRSRKVGGRVVREYIGAGLAGERAAAEDATRRAQHAAAAKNRRAEQERLTDLGATLTAFDVVTETLAQAALMIAGYHRHHRGPWRKRRDRQD